jgi:uncharacterized protein
MKNKIEWLESHPVVYALVVVGAVAVLGETVQGCMASVADEIASMVMYGSVNPAKVNDLGLVNTAIQLLSSVVVLLLFWFAFRKDLRGFFNVRRFAAAFLLGWGVLVASTCGLISTIVEQTNYGNFGAALLMGMQPGIDEEILDRVIPICLVMRSRNRERLIVPVIVFTSAGFGLTHGFNILAGADPVTTLFQVIYASCIGFLFAVIYLKTGDMWITMLLHTVIDTVYFLGAEAQRGGGVLTQGTNVADAVFMLACAALYFVNAFLLYRKTSKEEILNTWSGIWKSQAEN